MVYDDYEEWFTQSAVGATLSIERRIESLDFDLEFAPELRVHWLHEFNTDPDAETYTLANAGTYGATLLAREEDLLKAGVGIRVSKFDATDIEFRVDADGTFGKDYKDYTLGGKVIRRF